LALIGRGKELIRKSGPDPTFIEYRYADLLDIDSRAVFMLELQRILDEVEAFNFANSIITVDDDTFMEFLMNNIRNEVISYQAHIFRIINSSYKTLSEKVESL